MSGHGVFNPANIGTPKGGNAGLVLGDGSGLAPDTGSGTDLTEVDSNGASPSPTDVRARGSAVYDRLVPSMCAATPKGLDP